MKPYPAYKPSGVPWLGKVPAHWESKAAKFLVTCNDDVLTEDVDPATEIVYIEIADVEEGQGIKATADMLFKDAPSRARRQVKHGDIIVSTVRTYLKAIAAVENPPKNLVVSTGFAVLRPHGITQGFAKYAFAESGFINTVIARSNGVSYPAINATDLVRIPIPVPPAVEQQSIASYLDRETARIDELIREKEGLMGLLREMIAGVTTRVMTEGLSPSVELKQTNRPWFKHIPSHWELVQIRHVLGSSRDSMRAGPFGSQMTSNDMVDGGVKVYAQRHVIDNDFAQGENFVSKKKAGEMTVFFVQPGDVLFTTRGTIGRCAVVPDGAEMGVLHPCLIRVRFDESRISNNFVQYLVNSTEFFGQQLKEKSNATTIEVVYTDNLRAVAFPLPPLDEQKAIVEHLDRETARIDKLIAHVQDEIKLLQELRAATITDAVTGKIQVG